MDSNLAFIIRNMKTYKHLLCSLALMLPALAAQAAWPDRPITLVVPFPPGGGTDVISRLIGKELGDRLGVNVIVENKAGAGGNIGTRYAANAKPDGYTVLMGTTAQTISAAIYKQPGYDLLKQLDSVVTINSSPMVLFTRNQLKVSSVNDVIELAKLKPGTLTYASAGYGTSSHMAAEAFSLATGIKLLHVPYQGASLAMGSLAAGQVDLDFDVLFGGKPMVMDNKVKVLGIGDVQRSPLMPELKTLSEQNPTLLKNYNEAAWNVLMVPKGTPVEIQQALNDKVKAILNDESFKARLKEMGSMPFWKNVSNSTSFVIDDVAKWKKVVYDANIERM